MESDKELSKYHRLYTYPNGVTLIYFKHNINSTTNLRVGFVSGASADKIKGTAHFLEHMLVKETPSISQKDASDFMKNNGITMNAYTNENMIMLVADTPNSHLDEICSLYKSFLQNRYFDKKSIDLERMAIEQELNIYKDKEKRYEGIDFRLLMPDVYSSTDILGTKKSLAKINENVLREYIDRNFVSENLVVCVVSNLEFEEVKELTDKYFEHCAQSNPKLKAEIVDDEYAKPSNIFYLHNKPEQKTTSIEIMYRVDQDEKEADKFAWVEDFIFNDFAGKILKKLRTEKGFVYTASYYPYFLDKGLSLKALVARTSKPHVNDCITAIGQIISDIVKNGMSQEEYENFQKSIKTIEEEYQTGLKVIDPDILLDRYIHNREIFYNNQLHFVKDLSLEEINEYLRKTYDKQNVIVSIKGAIDEKKLFTPQEIEKKLHAKPSKALVCQSELFASAGEGVCILNPDWTFYQGKKDPKYLQKLDDEGKICFISGNVVDHVFNNAINKIISQNLKKLGITLDDLANGEYCVYIDEDNSIKIGLVKKDKEEKSNSKEDKKENQEEGKAEKEEPQQLTIEDILKKDE